MSKYKHIQKAAYAANVQLQELGLVIFTFGNVSVVERESGVFAIKPSGVPYEDLTPEKMVVVDFDGEIVRGDLRPSSDTSRMQYCTKNGIKWALLYIHIARMQPPGLRHKEIFPFSAPRMPITSL